MATMIMKFIVEIDGKVIIQHQIEEQTEKRSYFLQERKLTKEIIDKMNEFHSERWIDSKSWTDFHVNEVQ